VEEGVALGIPSHANFQLRLREGCRGGAGEEFIHHVGVRGHFVRQHKLVEVQRDGRPFVSNQNDHRAFVGVGLEVNAVPLGAEAEALVQIAHTRRGLLSVGEIREAGKIIDFGEEFLENFAHVGEMVGQVPIDELRWVLPCLLRQPIEGGVTNGGACGGVWRGNSLAEDELLGGFGASCAEENLRLPSRLVGSLPYARAAGAAASLCAAN
jgi:hypothetical protein